MLNKDTRPFEVSREIDGILDAPTMEGPENVGPTPKEKSFVTLPLPSGQRRQRYSPDLLWFLILGGIHLVLYPRLYLSYLDMGFENDCCASNPALLSPEDKWSVELFYILAVLAYFYSTFRKKLGPPLLEVLVECSMIAGFVLNVFIAIQINDWWLILVGNVPPAMLFVLRLSYNHLLILDQQISAQYRRDGRLGRLALRLLQLGPLQKYPLLVLLCLPLLALFCLLLLLFGQRPDSLVVAFTDTYKHGFSQIDCTGVVCPDEHFLCTIAAKGHKRWVKPLRMGVRQGWPIEVNRQLLVSNAFEELMEEKIPFLHRPIRKTYNIVGRRCKAVYKVLGNQWVSDVVYVLMKPLEYFFVVVLYLFDTKPENRIARQYLSAKDRARLAAGRGA